MRTRAWIVSALVVTVGATAAAPGAGRGPTRCDARRLRLAATFYGAAGGEFLQTFTFSNASRTACVTSGWPQVEIENAAGKTMQIAIRRVVYGTSLIHPYSRVVMQPGGAASFNLYGADFDARSGRLCASTGAVRAAPPRAGPLLVARVKIPLCRFGFYVAPLIAGRTDRRAWSLVWHR